MRKLEDILKSNRLSIVKRGEDGFAAFVIHPAVKARSLSVICSWGGGWDHVSIAYPNRLPTWNEMCFIKDIFFEEEECVVQFHPPKSVYVNNHPNCLHLWKKQDQEYETPPMEFVG